MLLGGKTLLGQEFIATYPEFTEKLTHPLVNTIYEDDHGHIWLGSLQGLNRFDGINVINYLHDPNDSTSLPINYLTRITSSPGDKDYYFLLLDKLFHFDPNTEVFTQLLDEGNIDISTYDVKRVYDINYAETNAGLYQLNGTATKKIQFDKQAHLNNQILSIAAGPNNQIVLSGVNLYLFNRELTQLLDSVQTPEGNYNFSPDFATLSNGLRIFLAGGNLYKSINGKTLPLKQNDLLGLPLLPYSFTDIYQDSLNTIWLTGTSGVFTISSSGKIVNHYNEFSQPANIGGNKIILLHDSHENIWLSGSEQIVVLSPIKTPFKQYYFNSPNGSLLSDNLNEFFETSNGIILIGTDKGVTTHRNGSATNQPQLGWLINETKNKPVSTIFESSESQFYIGYTNGEGLALYDIQKRSKLIIPIQTSTPSGFNTPSDIIADNKGGIWMCTHGDGIFTIKNKSTQPFLPEEITSGMAFGEQLLPEPDGEIIYRYNTGIAKINATHTGIQKFQLTAGADYPNVLSCNKITDDTYLLGGYYGVWKFNSTTGVSTFHKILLDNRQVAVHGAFILKNQYWLITSNGIIITDNEFKIIQHINGRLGLDKSSFYLTDQIITKNGECWIGNKFGLTIFKPENVTKNNSDVKLELLSIEIDGNKIYTGLNAIPEKLVLNPGDIYTRITFGLSEPLANINRKFRYRLNGKNAQWVELLAPEITLHSLSPGNYNLELQALNDDGSYTASYVIPITIQAPFYARWWFYLLCIIAVSGIMYAIYRYRIDKLLAVEKLRDRIARDLHDDIGSSLSGLHILSKVAEKKVNQPEEALKHLQQLSNRTQNITTTLDDLVWVVDPKRDSMHEVWIRSREIVGELIDVETTKVNMFIEEAILPLKADAILKKNLTLYIKEALNNIAKYAEATIIDISLTQKDKLMYLTISDNGNGFEIQQKLASGNGLGNFHVRASAIHGDHQIKSAPGMGCELTLTWKMT